MAKWFKVSLLALNILCIGTVPPVLAEHKPPIIFNDLTILVPSCDKYSEVWHPFFTFLFQQWPSLNGPNSHVPIVLVGNKRTYDDPRVRTILTGEDISWSDNILKALGKVKTKYVLIILEDFFLSEPVDEKRLWTLYESMKNEGVGYTQVAAVGVEIFKKGKPHKTLKGVRHKARFGIYRPSLEAAIWRKDNLEWLVRPGESAWDFEVRGNERSQGMREPFLTVVEDAPMKYINAVDKGWWKDHAFNYVKKQGIELSHRTLPLESDYPIYMWNQYTFKPFYNEVKNTLWRKKIRDPILNFFSAS